MSARVARAGASPLSRLAIRFIVTYRERVSARLPSRCRFASTCSEYALRAYQRYGFWTATHKTIGRLRRCAAQRDGSAIDLP